MMKLIGWLALGCGVMVACAQGSATDELPEDDGAGGLDGGGGTGLSTGLSTGPSTTTSDGAGPGAGGSPAGSGGGGAGAGEPMCGAGEHFCGGICVGNTPQTGCHQSTSCAACPPVANGTTKCSPEGICDFDCASPYVKSGSVCSCPTQCCTNADCGGSATCENGQCIEPCDEGACILSCFPDFGVCLADQCVCIS